MMRVLTFAAGAAVGFVLGTRAGRDTYEKMRDQSAQLWNKPAVQQKVTEARTTVQEKAPQVQEKAGDLAKKAAEKAHLPGGGNTAPGAAGGGPAVTSPAAGAPIVPPAPEGKHSL
ncbi:MULTISPECIES: YtxH domain-containing protein [unclassified Rhodococcus (in: high G+C Gram-positive bacteria)]|uniref:YtxH domain-containing protein n=1 Tax=unclassified Rhodococcus (in: high G+C Gram-positive bacteria) TaxID=192944 RepID=UPI00092748B5|nr:YtxH domain-containing protein [Rhodococcus sp. M8]OLL19933.1 hypothetical protein BKE56_008015 [Rhodococcus sp. M8]QPG43777.1 YtxH domain-containing protein [Rhodococcus sp. M8]